MGQGEVSECANDQLMLPEFPEKGVTHLNRVFEKRPVKGVTYECEETLKKA
jgi:hypothetical protein